MYAKIRVLTVDGPKEVEVDDPTDASRIAEHWNAIKRFLQTGDSEELGEFEDETIEGARLATDLEAIEAWDQAGALDFEEIYET